MLSFRFHIVSLVAVFLALGIGILMGTTVVNDFTIDTLEREIGRARRDVNEAETEIDTLQDDLRDVVQRDEQYLDESLPLLVAGRLINQPVMIIGADGIDRDRVNDLQDALATAGAAYQGTLWLNGSVALLEEGEVSEAGRILGRTSTDATSVRTTMLLRLADELVEPDTSDLAPVEPDDSDTLLVELVTAGFADYQAPAGASDEAIVPAPGTSFVLVGGRGSEVPSEEVLYPLLRNIAITGDTAPAVAAEGEDPEGEEGEDPEEPAPFIAPMRADDVLAEGVSTVDNLDVAAGRAAVVLALQQLQLGVVGHYGVADGAQRLLPAPVPQR